LLAAFCLLYGALPLLATAEAATSPVGPVAEPQLLSIPELYEKVKESRLALMENRLEVVKKANEAKQRLEELLAKNGKQGSRSMEALKKDLETIKEAQRVLATILSDIVSAISVEAGDGLKQAGGEDAAEKPTTPGVGKITGNSNEIMPSREYLASLIVLYDEKSLQLAKVIESLNNIVSLN
jgi:DNA-binding protein H-NS